MDTQIVTWHMQILLVFWYANIINCFGNEFTHLANIDNVCYKNVAVIGIDTFVMNSSIVY